MTDAEFLNNIATAIQYERTSLDEPAQIHALADQAVEALRQRTSKEIP